MGRCSRLALPGSCTRGGARVLVGRWRVCVSPCPPPRRPGAPLPPRPRAGSAGGTRPRLCHTSGPPAQGAGPTLGITWVPLGNPQTGLGGQGGGILPLHRAGGGSPGGLGSLGLGVCRGDPPPEHPTVVHPLPASPAAVSSLSPCASLSVTLSPPTHPTALRSPVPRDGDGDGCNGGFALVQVVRGDPTGGAGLAGSLRYVSSWGAQAGGPCTSPKPPPAPGGAGRWAEGTPRTDAAARGLALSPTLVVPAPRKALLSLPGCGSNGTSFEDDLTLGAEGTSHPRARRGVPSRGVTVTPWAQLPWWRQGGLGTGRSRPRGAATISSFSSRGGLVGLGCPQALCPPWPPGCGHLLG